MQGMQEQPVLLRGCAQVTLDMPVRGRHGGLFTAARACSCIRTPRACTRGREPLAPEFRANLDDTDGSQENITEQTW